MNSQQINDAIRKLENQDPPPYQSGVGDKPIPYIGWYWREVDFDAPSVTLAILPYMRTPFERNDIPRAGFCENNKWGYREFRVTGDAWQHLRAKIIIALTSNERIHFQHVEEHMQQCLADYERDKADERRLS